MDDELQDRVDRRWRIMFDRQLTHIAANFDLIIDATANLAVSRAVSAIAGPRRATVARVRIPLGSR